MGKLYCRVGCVRTRHRLYELHVQPPPLVLHRIAAARFQFPFRFHCQEVTAASTTQIKYQLATLHLQLTLRLILKAMMKAFFCSPTALSQQGHWESL